MRNVLVLIHEDDGQEARLQAALSVTRSINGHLNCLDVFTVPVIVADPWTGYSDTTLIKTASETSLTNRTKIQDRLSREDVAWTMLETTGDPAIELRDAAELADLIVVSSHGGTESMVTERAIVGNVVTKSRRPVLAVPPQAKPVDVAGHVLVAWDGSPSANEALRAAAPLLALSEGVTLLVINGSDGPFSAETAATYLCRHGVEPRILEQTTEGPVADAILEQARESEASYIVMGAFGHGRVIESLFGGVTRSVLAKSPVPVLMAH